MISIVTPTFNSEKVIAKNVSSVLKQNFRDFEHLIIDNKSTDSTLTIVNALYRENNAQEKLKIISEEDSGISDAFNKGIKKSSGDIIAILNSDDFYLDANLFREVVSIFEKRESVIVHGNILFADSRFGTNIRKPEYFPAYRGIVFQHPSMFIKREVYNTIGLYNLNYKISMDFELYCRLAKQYKPPDKYFYHLGSGAVVHMMAGGSSYINEERSIMEIKEALKEHGFYNMHGLYFVWMRLLRTRLKRILDIIGLKKIVTIWRKYKWGNIVKQQ